MTNMHKKKNKKEEHGNNVFVQAAFSEEMLVRLIDRIKEL
jgi:hypothetical protein